MHQLEARVGTIDGVPIGLTYPFPDNSYGFVCYVTKEGAHGFNTEEEAGECLVDHFLGAAARATDLSPQPEPTP